MCERVEFMRKYYKKINLIVEFKEINKGYTVEEYNSNNKNLIRFFFFKDKDYEKAIEKFDSYDMNLLSKIEILREMFKFIHNVILCKQYLSTLNILVTDEKNSIKIGNITCTFIEIKYFKNYTVKRFKLFKCVDSCGKNIGYAIK